MLLLLACGIMLTGSNTALYCMLFGLGMFTLATQTAKRVFQIAICGVALWAADHAEAVCGFSTVALFAIMVNAVPHAYGRFWTVPVLLALAPAITLLNEGPRRQRAQ